MSSPPSSPRDTASSFGTIKDSDLDAIRDTFSARAKKKRSRKSKLQQMFGEKLPQKLVQELNDTKKLLSESSSSLAKVFPRRRAIRFIPELERSYFLVPATEELSEEPEVDDEYLLEMFEKTQQLMEVDLVALSLMAEQLKEENRVLQLIAAPAAASPSPNSKLPVGAGNNKGSFSSVPSVVGGDIHFTPQLKNIKSLMDMNSVLHHSLGVITLSMESLKRGQQFHIPPAKPDKTLPQALQQQLLPSECGKLNANLIRGLVNRLYKQLFTKYPDIPEEKKRAILSFTVTKVNRSKNTQRVFELDQSESSLTICKRGKDDHGVFSNREVVIFPTTFISSSQSDKRKEMLSVSFYRHYQGKTEQKNWKVLCQSAEDCTRLYVLLQLIFPKAAKTEEKAYVPQPVRVTAQIKEKVQRIPVARLAREIHSIYVLQKLEDGWRFGEKYDEQRKVAPTLLPWDDLSRGDKAHSQSLITTHLATIIALKFAVEPPVTFFFPFI